MNGVNWFFVALVRHAREHGGGELRAWVSEQQVAEYLYGGTWVTQHEPHPDGLGIWAEGGRDIVFLLEFDTDTEHLRQLADKLPGYAERARHNLAFQVPILFCFLTPRREQSARNALAATGASYGLQIATAALEPSVTCPAGGPAWMPVKKDRRAWASALAATLPPLTESQVAAVARMAAHLDANDNQKRAA